jgi:hypothetical protein
MRGRDRSEPDWHKTRGHMCSHRREFFVLTWNEQGGESASGAWGSNFYEEITFICHRNRSLRSDHGMPNDVNWCEYSVSERGRYSDKQGSNGRR